MSDDDNEDDDSNNDTNNNNHHNYNNEVESDMNDWTESEEDSIWSADNLT